MSSSSQNAVNVNRQEQGETAYSNHQEDGLTASLQMPAKACTGPSCVHEDTGEVCRKPAMNKLVAADDTRVHKPQARQGTHLGMFGGSMELWILGVCRSLRNGSETIASIAPHPLKTCPPGLLSRSRLLRDPCDNRNSWDA